MWVVTGPFDGTASREFIVLAYGVIIMPTITNLCSLGTKLLKTGSNYCLGRKNQQLTIENPKISKHHLTFIIGSFTQEDLVSRQIIIE